MIHKRVKDRKNLCIINVILITVRRAFLVLLGGIIIANNF